MEKISNQVKALKAYLNTQDEVCCDFFIDGNDVRCFFYQDCVSSFHIENVMTPNEFSYMKKYSTVESYTQYGSLHSYAESMTLNHNKVIERLQNV